MDDIEREVNEFTKRAFLTKILYHREKENEYIMKYNRILCMEAIKFFNLPKNIVKCSFVTKYRSIWESKRDIILYFRTKKNIEFNQDFVHIIFEDDLEKQYIFLYMKDYLKIKYDGVSQDVSSDLIQKMKDLSDQLFYYQNEINLKK